MAEDKKQENNTETQGPVKQPEPKDTKKTSQQAEAKAVLEKMKAKKDDDGCIFC